MKIEIGESLVLSYLKHIKKCVFYQANWKVSSNWKKDSSEKVRNIYDKIKRDLGGDVFKKSGLIQLIRQSEIDLIGMDLDNTIYAIDIAFHEKGLNYGRSKEETKNRVIKKMLRSYLTLLYYFPNKKYEIIFVSPKVHKATEEIIRTSFSELDKNFSNNKVKFEYISNDTFRDKIVIPVIKKTIDDSDTNELFLRAVKLMKLFNLYSEPSQKNRETRISEDKKVENRHKKNVNPKQQQNFNLEFVPSDEKLFKQKLLQIKRADRTWYYSDGRVEKDTWNANKFRIESNLIGNIYSNNKVRQRGKTGLIRLKLAIPE